MPMTSIPGVYRIGGTAPDGDSIHFYPDDPTQWDALGGAHPVHRNAAGGAQLRLDAIDAPETHFAAGGRQVHQALDAAHGARDYLLQWLGFTSVERASSDAEKVTSSEPAEVAGYLFTRSADQYGRCIAFAGRGEPVAGSTSVFVTPEMVAETANAALLRVGWAYPTYYRALFPDLRQALTELVDEARPGAGVWPQDRTQTGLLVSGFDQLQDGPLVLPKLFRRLAAWLGLNAGNPSLAGFRDFLDAQADQLYILPTGHHTGLSTIVEVTSSADGDSVRLTYAPEELVFDEK